MTTEARTAFVLFFFAVWCCVGLVPWAIAAVIARGRGALAALPVALAAACAAGVAVPLIGLDNFRGFLLSLVVAVVAAAFGSMAIRWTTCSPSPKLRPASASRRSRLTM